jgi:hypothetical protein
MNLTISMNAVGRIIQGLVGLVVGAVWSLAVLQFSAMCSMWGDTARWASDPAVPYIPGIPTTPLPVPNVPPFLLAAGAPDLVLVVGLLVIAGVTTALCRKGALIGALGLLVGVVVGPAAVIGLLMISASQGNAL